MSWQSISGIKYVIVRKSWYHRHGLTSKDRGRSWAEGFESWGVLLCRGVEVTLSGVSSRRVGVRGLTSDWGLKTLLWCEMRNSTIWDWELVMEVISVTSPVSREPRRVGPKTMPRLAGHILFSSSFSATLWGGEGQRIKAKCQPQLLVYSIRAIIGYLVPAEVDRHTYPIPVICDGRDSATKLI